MTARLYPVPGADAGTTPIDQLTLPAARRSVVVLALPHDGSDAAAHCCAIG